MDINQLLERIALAFEEQNRINQHWIDINDTWHKENVAGTERIIAIHKANADRDEQWRKAQETVLEESIRKQEALTQSAHDAYLEHLKEQAKPPELDHLVEAALQRIEREMRMTGMRPAL
jgi:uncharacterized protein YdaT